MKAIVITNFGSPEVLAEQDVNQPTPNKNQVLVKVYATSVNPADCGVRQGFFGPRVKLPTILGYDVSGVVEAVGENVRGFQVGDQVYYAIELLQGDGANAEYHVADESIVAKKPANLTHIEAASVPIAGGTAYAALITRANIKIGETVLIHGGAGGVGTFAIQIAKAAGAYVYTTCGSYDVGFVKSIGADRAIDYRQEDFVNMIMEETGGAGVDVSFTTVGGDVFAKSLMVTKPDGRAVTVAGVAGDLNVAMFKNLTIHCVHLDRTRPKLDVLRSLIERSQIKPVIGMVFPLNQVGEAHKRLESGGEGVRGKIVVEVR
ncbi:MAG: NADPH:quinone oxidoreductase [Nodularia sp. (in: Bacteria)]|nr:MAG: NADPH:quinone oxidoreductase [Nodularia sp. (in: cyanobacteria)]